MTRLSLLWLALLIVLVGNSAGALPTTQKTYDFTVFLEDEEVGTQSFTVSSRGDRTQVRVEARFDVTFWLFTAYTYRHTNVETWEGECLQEILANTNDNGDSFFVSGTYQDGRLLLQTHAGQDSLKGCVKSFAYWDLDRLQSNRLLNSQTGEYQAVELVRLGEQTLSVRGVPTPTVHHRIISEKFTIDLWHTRDGEWVALQSTTESGDILRYQLE